MDTLSDLKRLPIIAPRPVLRSERRQQDRRGPSRPPIPGAGERERRLRNERRATPRIEVTLDCEEQINGTRYFRVTRDLSTFGLSTRSGDRRQLGARFDLRLYLPDDAKNPVQVQAEVVGWNNEDAGMRLAFRNPSAEAVRRIHKFLVTQVG